MSRPTTDARWLTRLRWLMIAGEAAVGAIWVTTGRAPWLWILCALAAQGAANLALSLAPRGSTGTVTFGLTIDVLSLTALLALGGGSSSPFCVVLLVQVTVAAVALRGAHLWSIVALAIAAYASLFAFADASHGAGFSAHLQEMWLAFTVTALLIAAAVSRLAVELEEARTRADASSRVMGMTTLAAGAAHELATPLATIKTVVGELERELKDRPDLGHVREDLALVRGEVARSRAILDQLSSAAGELRGEAPSAVSLTTLRGSLDALPPEARERVRWDVPEDASAQLPTRAIGQALLALVSNALDASPPGETVEVRARLEDGELRLSVTDHGRGMSADTLARAGEPFFTTKDPGRGMGLGVFLVKALAAHLDGEVTIDSSPGRGTSVTMRLPQPQGIAP